MRICHFRKYFPKSSKIILAAVPADNSIRTQLTRLVSKSSLKKGLHSVGSELKLATFTKESRKDESRCQPDTQGAMWYFTE